MDMPANAKTQTISRKKYVFIDTPYWNAEKHRGEHKRRYIGKIVEGQFVPNGKYLLLLEKSGTIKPGPPQNPIGSVFCIGVIKTGYFIIGGQGM